MLCPCCETRQEAISMHLFVQVKHWVTVTFWIIMRGSDYAADRKSMASQKSVLSPTSTPPVYPNLQRAAWAQLTSTVVRVGASSHLVLLEELARTHSYHFSCTEAPCWLLTASSFTNHYRNNSPYRTISK